MKNNNNQKCLTLVANTEINQAQLETELHSLVPIVSIHSRAEFVWDIICPVDFELTERLRQKLYSLDIDFALQLSRRLPKKIFISDMDATIVVGETIDEMALAAGKFEEVSLITKEVMLGEISYYKALSDRLMLLKGMPQSTIEEIACNIEYTPGVSNLMHDIKTKNIYSCLVSGGFRPFTEAVTKKLGFLRQIANQLSYDNNRCLDGKWVGDLVNSQVKLSALETIAEELNVGLEQTIAIGDGANDRLMVKAAGLGVAFYGKPILRKVANAEIHSGPIDNLVWFI